eukprot:6172870-Pleurochrysis_carterae.AAC.2
MQRRGFRQDQREGARCPCRHAGEQQHPLHVDNGCGIRMRSACSADCASLRIPSGIVPHLHVCGASPKTGCACRFVEHALRLVKVESSGALVRQIIRKKIAVRRRHEGSSRSCARTGRSGMRPFR